MNFESFSKKKKLGQRPTPVILNEKKNNLDFKEALTFGGRILTFGFDTLINFLVFPKRFGRFSTLKYRKYFKEAKNV